MQRKTLGIISSVLFAVFCSGVSKADAQHEKWPEQPIRMIVPFAPGGSNDVIARKLSEYLTSSLKQSVVIENRAGGGGIIGTNAVANAKADGYTYLFTSNSLATTAAIQQVPYDPQTSLAAVSLVADAPLVILARNGFTTSLPELIAYAKAKPGKLNYGTAGIGDTNHLATAMLNHVAGIEMEAIGYKGVAPAQIDLVAGRLDMMITTIASIRGTPSEALPMLAFTASSRNAAYPDIPTVHEATGLDYDVGVWWAVFAPSGTPQPIINKMNAAIRSAISTPQFSAFLQSLGASAKPSSPADMQALLAKDSAMFSEIARLAGIGTK